MADREHPPEAIEAVARAIHAAFEAEEKRRYEADRSYGWTQPEPFEAWQAEWEAKALVALDALVDADLIVWKRDLRTVERTRWGGEYNDEPLGRERRFATPWERVDD